VRRSDISQRCRNRIGADCARVGGVYLIDMNPETGKLRLAGDLPTTGSGIRGIRFDRDEWPHGKTGPAFAHGAVFSPVK
jgi:hypothetical protein